MFSGASKAPVSPKQQSPAAHCVCLPLIAPAHYRLQVDWAAFDIVIQSQKSVSSQFPPNTSGLFGQYVCERESLPKPPARARLPEAAPRCCEAALFYTEWLPFKSWPRDAH